MLFFIVLWKWLVKADRQRRGMGHRYVRLDLKYVQLFWTYTNMFWVNFYLSDKLNDLNEDVEGCVPGHHAARALREKCCNNTEETTVRGKEIMWDDIVIQKKFLVFLYAFVRGFPPPIMVCLWLSVLRILVCVHLA